MFREAYRFCSIAIPIKEKGKGMATHSERFFRMGWMTSLPAPSCFWGAAWLARSGCPGSDARAINASSQRKIENWQGNTRIHIVSPAAIPRRARVPAHANPDLRPGHATMEGARTAGAYHCPAGAGRDLPSARSRCRRYPSTLPPGAVPVSRRTEYREGGPSSRYSWPDHPANLRSGEECRSASLSAPPRAERTPRGASSVSSTKAVAPRLAAPASTARRRSMGGSQHRAQPPAPTGKPLASADGQTSTRPAAKAAPDYAQGIWLPTALVATPGWAPSW